MRSGDNIHIAVSNIGAFRSAGQGVAAPQPIPAATPVPNSSGLIACLTIVILLLVFLHAVAGSQDG